MVKKNSGRKIMQKWPRPRQPVGRASSLLSGSKSTDKSGATATGRRTLTGYRTGNEARISATLLVGELPGPGPT